MTARDESVAFAALGRQRDLLKPLVAEHGGEWLKELGEGLLLSFPSSVKAVNCAVAIQQATAEEANLNLRVAVHQGEIIVRGSDVFGDGMNIAQRMEPHAPVGGVAISNRVQEDIASLAEFTTEGMGFPPLKGVAQEMELHCVVSHSLPRPEKHWAKGAGTTPDVIGDYKLVRAIGRGAFGEIWLARSVTGKYFALKIVRRANFENDGPYQREFQGIQQYETISRGYPGLVDLLHVGGSESEGYFYYVMELADDQTGQPLSDPDTYEARTLLSDRQLHTRLSTDDTLQAGITLARGLAHLHASGFLHRDVKPANVIYVNGQARLADIGLLTTMDNANTLVGTPAYFPPEGPGRAAADIYALGIVLYELATAQALTDFPAFPEADDSSASAAKFRQLQKAILKAAAHSPDQRHAEAGQLATELEAILQGTRTTEPQFYLQKDGQQFGPFPLAQVRAQVKAGAFAGNDLCWEESHANWQPLSKALKLEPEAEPAPPPPPTEHPTPTANRPKPTKLFMLAGVGAAVLAALAFIFLGGDTSPDEPIAPGLIADAADWKALYTGQAHEGVIRAVVFDPHDNTIVASISDMDGEPPKVWSYVTGETHAKISGHSYGVMCLAYHPTEAFLASGSGDDQVIIRDFTDTRGDITLSHAPVENRDGTVSALAWSSRGDWLITGSMDLTVRLWNPKTGNEMARITEHQREINGVAFNPKDNKMGASVCEAGEVKIWNINDGVERHLANHEDGAAGLAFSPDGTQIATAGNNGDVKIWATRDGETLTTLQGHDEGIVSVAYHPSGNWLASGSDDDTVII